MSIYKHLFMDKASMPESQVKSKSFFSGNSTRASLLQRVQAGKEEAWFEFYGKYAALIRSVGMKNKLSPAECDDLMVDVMVIFWRKMESFLYDPRKGRFRSYLSRIAFFAAIKRRQKQMLTCGLDELPEYPDGVDEEVMNEWRDFLFQKALEELQETVDSETFNVFYMSFVQKRPVQDICTITRRTANNVYVIRSRCLKKLRKIISVYRKLEETELMKQQCAAVPEEMSQSTESCKTAPPEE